MSKQMTFDFKKEYKEQTVDKLGAGCYAQYHFSLNFDFILVLS